MDKKELLEKLKDLSGPGDPEISHSIADELLLKYINDEEITKAFDAIEKWYA